MAKDYTSTLNLPKTDFPMRANLPQREPEMQKAWEDEGIYEKRGQAELHSSRRTSLL